MIVLRGCSGGDVHRPPKVTLPAGAQYLLGPSLFLGLVPQTG